MTPGSPRTGRVAVRSLAVFRDAGQGRQLPDRGQRAPGERAHVESAADWRLFCPQSWDDTALADPVAAARARRRREQARIRDDVRHSEKRLPSRSSAGTDVEISSQLFRLQLREALWQSIHSRNISRKFRSAGYRVFHRLYNSILRGPSSSWLHNAQSEVTTFRNKNWSKLSNLERGGSRHSIFILGEIT